MSDKGLVGRRTVVTGALAMAATAAAAPARAAALGTVPKDQPFTRTLATADLAAWQAAIGSVFTARTEVGIVSLRLAAVHPLSSGGTRPAHLPRANAFEAVFAPLDGRRPSGHAVYVLAGGGRDPMAVYFGPSTGPLAAVFN